LNDWPGLTNDADGLALTFCRSINGWNFSSLLYRSSARLVNEYVYSPGLEVSIEIDDFARAASNSLRWMGELPCDVLCRISYST
jgi:hypothetical protein